MARTIHPQELERRLGRIRTLAVWLDLRFVIPGTGIKLGWDPLIGLIPGVGDLLTGILSGWIVVESARLGVPRRLVARMVGNILLEVVVGTVPVLGDAFDVFWRSNLRNLRLAEKHFAKK